MADPLVESTCEITSNISSITCDHPEVLDRETLIDILHQKGIPSSEINDLEKADLVTLFYRYAAPLPQRLHQLRRAKRKPPGPVMVKDEDALDGLIESSRKRIPDDDGPVQRKLPKSDISHIVINKGPMKNTPDTSQSHIVINEGPMKNKPMKNIPNIDEDINQNGILQTSINRNLKRISPEKAIKSRPIKLIRKSVTSHIAVTEHLSQSKQALDDGKTPDVEAATKSSDSEAMDQAITETKKQFKKVSITWP